MVVECSAYTIVRFDWTCWEKNFAQSTDLVVLIKS